jgi:uncharacterized membrane protein
MQIIIIALLYVLGPVLIILFYNGNRIARRVGTILMSYGLGIIMSLSGLMDFSHIEKVNMAGIQDWIMNIAVPLAIPLMLFSSDLKLWRKSMKKTIAACIGGIVSVCLAVIFAFILFHWSGIEDLWKIGGMMVGMFTGGSMNFAAVGRIVEIDPSVFTLISAFEMVLSFLFLLFILGGGYKLFRKWLPFHDKSITLDVTEEIDYSFEKYKGMLKPHSFGKTLIGFGLSVVFLVVGAGLSMLITGSLNALIVIFTITTLAICCSFVEKIRSLPKTFELGMYFINMFSVVIASMFDISALNPDNLLLIGLIAFIILISTLLHLLFSRIFKIDGDLFTAAHVAALYSPPFVVPVVATMGNRKVLISGIVIGLMGYAIGTYLGVGMAWILRLF